MFPDSISSLEINGTKNQVIEKLVWYKYVLGILPLLLVFVGGLVGGIFGVLGMFAVFNTFRTSGDQATTYFKVFGILAATFFLYFAITFLVLYLLK